MLHLRKTDGLDYGHCQYGTSRLIFRGPKRTLNPDAVAFIGGSETFGAFVERPFPDVVQSLLSRPAVNLGCMNAGLGAFEEDETVIEAASSMRAVVLQAPDPANMTTAFWRVHPRRNDRFVEALPPLRELFPTIDFTDFTFVRHMIARLAATDADAFATVASEVAHDWVDRVGALSRRIAAPVTVLWVRPADDADRPLSVTEDMMDRLSQNGLAVVVATPSDAVRARARAGMVYGPSEAAAAAALPGPAYHAEIALTVTEAIAPYVAPMGRRRSRTPSMLAPGARRQDAGDRAAG